MAINVKTKYPANADAPSLDYPTGSFRNDTSPESEDGTPLEKDWANDWLGFRDATLDEAEIVANGVVETAQASQVLNAILSMINTRVAPSQLQAIWDSGLLTTESSISPVKLDSKIKTLAIGEVQTWQNVGGSRSLDVNYTNSTGRSIMISASIGVNTEGQNVIAIVNGVTILACPVGGFAMSVQFIVPNGGVYSLSAPSGIQSWAELR